MRRKKKLIRDGFRMSVFERDGFTCRVCGRRFYHRPTDALNAHHIIPRKQMPNGGYVVENGISLCKVGPSPCHLLVENGHLNEEELFAIIRSSREKAVAASEAIGA